MAEVRYYYTGQTIRDIRGFHLLRVRDKIKHQQLQAFAEFIEEEFPDGAPSIAAIQRVSEQIGNKMTLYQVKSLVKDALKHGYLVRMHWKDYLRAELDAVCLRKHCHCKREHSTNGKEKV